MTKFITNQNVEIQLELASLGDRIIAFLIDGLIIGAYYVALGMLLGGFGVVNDYLFYVMILPTMFYSLLFETFYNGQSPGKKARDIKVVKLDGGAPSIGNYLLRWIIRPIDIIVYGAVAMLSIILTKNGQRLGDLAAGTTVIKIHNRAEASSLQTQKRDDGYIIQFPQVKLLSDRQVELIRQSLKMGEDGLNYTAIGELSTKIKEHLKISSDLPDVKFLYTIIADYEQLD